MKRMLILNLCFAEFVCYVFFIITCLTSKLFAGFFCPQNSSAPTVCSPGHYCPENSSLATKCPLGYFEKDGSNRITFNDTCSTCPAGTYGGDNDRQVSSDFFDFH